MNKLMIAILVVLALVGIVLSFNVESHVQQVPAKIYQDCTATGQTWMEFKLDLIESVRKSGRSNEEKIKLINEIMDIPMPEVVK